MSGSTNINEHEGHDSESGAAHSTLKGYVTGFVLSVILTAIPFWIVMAGVITDSKLAGLTVMGFAIVQVLVHLVYFLHLDFRSENGWTMLATIFALIIVFVTFVGSVWVMYHSNANMMPGMLEHGAQGAYYSQ